MLHTLIPVIHADKARCVCVPQKQNGTSKLDKLHCEMLDRRGLQRGLQQVQQWDATHMEWNSRDMQHTSDAPHLAWMQCTTLGMDAAHLA